MKTILSKLSLPALSALLVGLALSGCDRADDPAEPGSRDARVVLEVDGERVQTWEVAAPGEAQAGLDAWVETAPAADVCDEGTVELSLVLEQDGEALGSFESCVPADAEPEAVDALTTPGSEANFWCTSCELYGDCLPCCKCQGWGTGYCAGVCV